MFLGNSSLSLDAKGRLAVPTRHRDALSEGAGTITITKHPDGSLMIFPQAAWEGFRDRVVGLTMDATSWRRFFLGNAMDVEMDATGRILVSPELRAFAGITREATLLGMGTYLELWNSATYTRKETETMQAEIPSALKEFSF